MIRESKFYKTNPNQMAFKDTDIAYVKAYRGGQVFFAVLSRIDENQYGTTDSYVVSEDYFRSCFNTDEILTKVRVYQ